MSSGSVKPPGPETIQQPNTPPVASPQTSPLRLGDLLTGAGLLKAEELRQAMLIAKTQGLPVGRVIIMSGFMLEQHLQAAVQAQSLLKDGLISAEAAVAALRNASREGTTLDEALSKLGVQQGGQTNKLGELLVESGLVTKEQLESSLGHGKTSGLPLGRVLVVTGVLSEQLLASALNAQILIRDKRVEREQAISSLRAAKERQVPLEQALAENGLTAPANETVRLGELFVMAKIIDDAKLMQAVELGLVNEKPIGQVLLENGFVSPELLQQALAIQTYVSSGKLRKSLSGQVLELIQKEKLSVEAAIDRVQPDKQQISNNLPLYQFLQLAGVIGPKDIEEALKAGSRNAQLMGQMLLLTGSVDQNLLSIALKCTDLMAQGILKAEQAVIALGICWKTKATLEDAFRQLGWSPAIIAAAFPPQSAKSQPTAGFSHTQSGQQSQSPLAQALNRGNRGADATGSAMPALQNASEKRRSDATSNTLPALNPNIVLGASTAMPHDTGENSPIGQGSSEETRITGDHPPVGSTPATEPVRKKKLSDLIPQIKNQG